MKRSIDDESESIDESNAVNLPSKASSSPSSPSPSHSPSSSNVNSFSSPSQSSPEKAHKRPVRRNKLNQPDFNASSSLSESSQAALVEVKQLPKKGKESKCSGRLSPTLTSLIFDEPEVKKNPIDPNQSSDQNNYQNNEPDFLPTTIFIGELKQHIEEDVFAQVFGRFGHIESIRAMKGKNFAFITFYHPDSARNAVDVMNGGTLMGGRIKVAIARNPNSKSYNPTLGKKTAANLPMRDDRYNEYNEQHNEKNYRNDNEPKRTKREEPPPLKPATNYPEYDNFEPPTNPHPVQIPQPVTLKPASDYPSYSDSSS